VDEIDRSLLTEVPLGVPPRFAWNVMAEVRAVARPARPRFPWQQLSLKLASYAGYACAAAIVFRYADAPVFVPVTRELFLTGSILAVTLAAIRLPHFLSEAGD
jgi:hypothetical protein